MITACGIVTWWRGEVCYLLRLCIPCKDDYRLRYCDVFLASICLKYSYPAKKITACGIRNQNPQTKANGLKFEDFLCLYAEFNLVGTYKK